MNVSTITNGVNFPNLRVTGFENVMNGVTFPTLPATSNVGTLTQSVTVPTVPPVSETSSPSMNWLWILAIIPVGLVVSALKS